jgi:S-adenosylmethionine decarboxylase
MRQIQIQEAKSKTVSKEEYESEETWGLLTSIDLHDCDVSLIRDAEKIKQFVVELCEQIDMKRFGDCFVVDFGQNPKVTGFSMTQLIETSLISGHFGNEYNGKFAYLDIFSCKWYDQEKAVEFAKRFFNAKKSHFDVVIRGRAIN